MHGLKTIQRINARADRGCMAPLLKPTACAARGCPECIAVLEAQADERS